MSELVSKSLSNVPAKQKYLTQNWYYLKKVSFFLKESEKLSPMGKVGTVIHLEQSQFTTEDWQLVTDIQVLRSLLKILRVSDEGYRMLYVKVKLGLVSGETSSLLKVWAGWTVEPVVGSILVCVHADECCQLSSLSSSI